MSLSPSSPFYSMLTAASDDDEERKNKDRIADDTTGGRRTTSPQSPTTTGQPSSPRITGSRYDAAAMHPYSPGYPVEQDLSRNMTEYQRMTTPPPPASFLQRIRNTAGAGLAGFAGGPQAVLGQATLRDRVEARKQQERENVRGAISADTRTLGAEGLATERMQSQERLQQQGLMERARLQEEAETARQQNLMATLAQRTGAQQASLGEKQREFGITTGEKYREFQSTDQYRRWKEQFDNATKLQVAQLQQSKAPASLIQTAVFADGGIKSLNDAEGAMQRLERAGVFGQSWAQNKVEDWIWRKGAVDPSLPPDVRRDIGILQQSLELSASAMTRAHTARGSKEVYDDLKGRLGPGQDWSALRGAISESQDMLGQYVTAASDANVRRIRAGEPNANAPQQPQQAPPRPASVPPDAKWDPQTRRWYK